MMKDKVKGLVLGLSLGVMLTGSAAFAAGTQIEVYFRELRYMFDGMEKKPTAEQGAGFIHNGTTYVPLRFVSEALGKEVGWDDATGTIWIGKKIDLSQPVAEYNGGQVTLGELNKRLAVNRLLSNGSLEDEQQNGYKEYILRELIAYRILASRVSDTDRTAALAEAAEQYAGIRQSLQQAAGGSDLSVFLAKEGLAESDLQTFAEEVSLVRKALWGAVSDESLKSAYETKKAAGDLTIATVRHILIGLEDASGNPRTKEAAKAKAEQIADKLRKGADFAELAKLESDDPGSKDNGGVYEDAPVSEWVEPFKKASIELKLNEISNPVETNYGYHVIRVEKRSELTFDEKKDDLRQEAIGGAYSSFVTKELPGLITKLELPSE